MRIKRSKGFTVIELITVSVIFLFVLTAVYSLYIMLHQYIANAIVQVELQSGVNSVMENMARNIRMATSVECNAAGTNIRITFDPVRLGQTGDVWRSDYDLTSENKLYFKPDTSVPGRGTLILENVALNAGSKLFQYDGSNDLVIIDLRVEKDSLTATKSFRLITVVKLRNA